MGNSASGASSSSSSGSGSGSGSSSVASPYRQLHDDHVRELVQGCGAALQDEFGSVGGVLRLQAFTDAPPLPLQHAAAFRVDAFLTYCRAAVLHDPVLAKSRFRWVPNRISEEQFWRGYISRLLVHAGSLETADHQLLTAANPRVAPQPESDTSDDTADNIASEEDSADNGASDDDAADNGASDVAEVLLALRECFAYVVPPLEHSGGYYAQRWRLDTPLRTCSMNLVALDGGRRVAVRLLEQHDGALFAQSLAVPVGEALRTLLQPVLDSSRYFVVRFTDAASGKHALLGIGFRHRSAAFDVNAALADHVRRMRRVLGTHTHEWEVDDDDDGDDGDGGRDAQGDQTKRTQVETGVFRPVEIARGDADAADRRLQQISIAAPSKAAQQADDQDEFGEFVAPPPPR